MPSYKHVELSIRVSGVLIYQLAATGVADLRMHTDPGHDTLEIVVSGEDRVSLRLSPSVLVTQQIGDGTQRFIQAEPALGVDSTQVAGRSFSFMDDQKK